jgi:hypothetical protein
LTEIVVKGSTLLHTRESAEKMFPRFCGDKFKLTELSVFKLGGCTFAAYPVRNIISNGAGLA